MKMKATLIVMFFLFVAALVVHSAEAAGQMGGYVGRGGKLSRGVSGGTYHSTSRRKASSSCQPDEITHVKQPPPPPLYDAESAAGAFYIILFGVFVGISIYCCCEGVKTTLMMVQVAVKNNSAEIDLHFSLCSRIANQWMLDKNGDGSKLSTKGASFMLSETIWRILLHPECCYAATSIVDRKISWKMCFEQICVEQSKKSNRRINEQSIGKGQVPEYVVVTVLVATNRDYKLPAINCLADLEKAFSCLKSISGTDIAAVKVFWTNPVGMEELDEEFPQLRPLRSQQPHSTPRAIHVKPPALPSTQSQCHEAKLVEELQKLNPLVIQQPHPELLHRRGLYRTNSWS